MLNRRFGVGITLFLLGLATSLAADELPFAAIPAQTGLVLRCKNPATAIDKIVEFTDKLRPNPDEPRLIPMDGELDWGTWLRASLDEIVESFGDNVDKQQDWWIFCPNPFDSESSYAYVVPLIDISATVATIAGKNEASTLESVVYKKWVVYGTSAVVDSVKGCIAGEKQSIEARLNADALAVFLQGEVGAFVDVRELTADEEKVTGTREELESMISDWIPDFEPVMAGDFFGETIDQFVEAFFLTMSDTETLATSMTIDAEGIRIENYHCVKADSATAAFLGANPGTDLELLSLLPPSSALYWGFQGNQKALTSWTTKYLKKITEGTQPGLSPAHEEIRKDYEELNYGAFAIAYPVWPVDQGILRSQTITEVDNPTRARELSAKWLELPDCMAELPGASKAPPILGTEKIGDYSADVVKVAFQMEIGAVPGDADNLKNSIEELLYGPGGATIRTVYLGNRVVDFVGGTKVRMAAAIRHIADPRRADSRNNSQFMKTRELLGKNVNLIAMADIGAVIAGSMFVWNSYIDTTMELMGVQEMHAGEVELKEKHFDEGLPEEAEVASEGEENAGEENMVVQAIGVDVEFDDVTQMKFEKDEIDSMHATSTLVGLSLAFEPHGSRLRIVIPLDAAQKIAKALSTMTERMGGMIDGAEVEVLEIIEDAEGIEMEAEPK